MLSKRISKTISLQILPVNCSLIDSPLGPQSEEDNPATNHQWTVLDKG